MPPAQPACPVVPVPQIHAAEPRAGAPAPALGRGRCTRMSVSVHPAARPVGGSARRRGALPAHMRAMVIDRFGPPGELSPRRVARPDPGPGEVLVRVHAAGVSTLDRRLRAGWGAVAGAVPLPAVLGRELSGVVAAVGPGVTGPAVGTRVFGLVPGGGAYAEYALAAAGHLRPAPARASHVSAAALPLGALAAWQALLDVARLRPGQRLLVHGAAGGVGHLAVQLGRWRGAQVVATASPGDHGFLRGLGCHEAVDYHDGHLADLVEPVDVALDVTGHDALAAVAALRPGGTVVSLPHGVDWEDPTDRGRRLVGLKVRADGEQLARVAELVDEGVLRPHVAEVHELAGAVRAHEVGERGHVRGKLVLRAA